MTQGLGADRSPSEEPAKRRRILYIQPGTRSFAGIERVVDTVCSKLVERYANTFDVDVLYTSVHQNAPAGERHYTAIHRIAESRRMLLQVIRSTIRGGRYDLVVVPQIEPTVICWFACLGLRQRFAMHLHGNPHRERSHLKAKILFMAMRYFVLRRVSYVFGTSPRQLDAFHALFPSSVPRCWVPNPVRRFGPRPGPGLEPERPITFVNVGRFSFQKGQDILIDAFHRLYSRRADVRLLLVGHGSDEAALRGQVERLHLGDVVDIQHLPENPEAALAAADVYVSTSRWEGWSLVICEALRFGLPVVATDCDFGPSDILTDARLGRLVPLCDQQKLVDEMLYYCGNLARERQWAALRMETIDQYDAERVIDLHASALQQACQGGGPGRSGGASRARSEPDDGQGVA